MNFRKTGSKNTAVTWVGREGHFRAGLRNGVVRDAAATGERPVKTAEGWHVIRLAEIKPETAKPFEAVRADLEKEYLDSERERIGERSVGKLVDIVYPIRRRSPPPPTS